MNYCTIKVLHNRNTRNGLWISRTRRGSRSNLRQCSFFAMSDNYGNECKLQWNVEVPTPMSTAHSWQQRSNSQHSHFKGKLETSFRKDGEGCCFILFFFRICFGWFNITTGFPKGLKFVEVELMSWNLKNKREQQRPFFQTEGCIANKLRKSCTFY